MPIYEYRCAECGQVSELLTGVGGAGNDVICSSCGSRRMERILSVPSIPASDHERAPGRTCCGKEERCSTPPFSTGDVCARG